MCDVVCSFAVYFDLRTSENKRLAKQTDCVFERFKFTFELVFCFLVF